MESLKGERRNDTVWMRKLPDTDYIIFECPSTYKDRGWLQIDIIHCDVVHDILCMDTSRIGNIRKEFQVTVTEVT